MGGAVSMGGRVGSGGGVGTGSSAATGGAIGAGGLSASGGVVSTGPVGAGGRAGTGGTPGIGTTGGATTVTSGAQASSGGCSCRTAGVETRSYRVFALLGFVMVALRLRKRRSMTGAEGDGGTSTVTGAVRKPMVEITAPECSSPSASTGTPMGFWLGTGGIP
jgi:MYXO-CTERM domain-containing protein